MEFTLVYDGPLRANGDVAHKHAIRRQLHLQLKTLWHRSPLIDHQRYFTLPDADKSIDLNRPVGAYRFVPLVSESWWLVCAIKLFFLRPEPPGAIITQGGDIDNRLKTLFDALRYPKNVGELPKGATPDRGETPFFCLLEDDNLITMVSVETDQLLVPGVDSGHVHLDLRVSTRARRSCFANLGLV